MKSGNLNFLEPSGPFQACNGTALLYIRINVVLLRGRALLYDSFTFYGIFLTFYDLFLQLPSLFHRTFK